MQEVYDYLLAPSLRSSPSFLFSSILPVFPFPLPQFLYSSDFSSHSQVFSKPVSCPSKFTFTSFPWHFSGAPVPIASFLSPSISLYYSRVSPFPVFQLHSISLLSVPCYSSSPTLTVYSSAYIYSPVSFLLSILFPLFIFSFTPPSGIHPQLFSPHLPRLPTSS